MVDVPRNLWPTCLENLVQQFSVTCSSCEQSFPAVLRNRYHSKLKFIEFSPELTNQLRFQNLIAVNGINYKLKAMVHHNIAHFTCCVKKGNIWYFIDDLSPFQLTFPTIEGVYSAYSSSWFFGIYVMEQFDSDIESESNLTNVNNLENTNLKRNIKDNFDLQKNT